MLLKDGKLLSLDYWANRIHYGVPYLDEEEGEEEEKMSIENPGKLLSIENYSLNPNKVQF